MTLLPPNIATTTARSFINAAIRYRIFEVLETGAMSLAELCASTHAAAHNLRPIMNALIGLQLVATDGKGCFALTDRCDTLLLAEISARLRSAGFDHVRTANAPGLEPLLIFETEPKP